MLERLKQWASRCKAELTVIRLALADARTPWYARWLGVVTVAYALSPLDLIPDFIPVLGYLDDLLLLPVGLYLTLRLIPAEVKTQARARVEQGATIETASNRLAGLMVITIWVLAALLLAATIWRLQPF